MDDSIETIQEPAPKHIPAKSASHRTAIISVIFSVITIAVIIFSVITIKAVESKAPTRLDNAKLAVFNDLVSDFVENQKIVNVPAVQQLTGYGISDEDNSFYVTLNYYTYDEGGVLETTPSPVVAFFLENADGTYSYRYVYPEYQGYHPKGVYVSIDESDVNPDQND